MKLFDRMADRTEKVASHAAFFACCILLILLWAPLVLWLSIDTWQLIINTATTIITFLLLALLTNTQRRFEERVEAKLSALLNREGIHDGAAPEAPGNPAAD